MEFIISWSREASRRKPRYQDGDDDRRIKVATERKKRGRDEKRTIQRVCIKIFTRQRSRKSKRKKEEDPCGTKGKEIH